MNFQWVCKERGKNTNKAIEGFEREHFKNNY
jgi:hypothetical protein